MKKTILLALLILIFIFFLLYQLDNYLLDDEFFNTSKESSVMQTNELPQSLQKTSSSQDHNGFPSKQLQPEIKQALDEILDTSSKGLEEVETDKGEMVDLDGRFRTVPVATIDENGDVSIRDYVSPPGD